MPSNPDDKNEEKNGKLYIVSTPIGNLADITLRALDTLRAVDLIAAEDTRHTRKLLSYYDIHKPLVSYHEHNARQRGEQLLEKLASGRSIALVTDAGTPGISDPGKLLIEAALAKRDRTGRHSGSHGPHSGPGRFRAAASALCFFGFSSGQGRRKKALFRKIRPPAIDPGTL